MYELSSNQIYVQGVTELLMSLRSKQAKVRLVVLPSADLKDLPPEAFTDKLLVVDFDFSEGNWLGEQVSITEDYLKCCLAYPSDEGFKEYWVKFALSNVVSIRSTTEIVFSTQPVLLYSPEMKKQVQYSRSRLYFPKD
jgi:hypothetical protein